MAMFFVATIDTLDADVKLALSTLSCFGNSVHCEIIDYIEADLGLNITKPLDDAIDVGLLEKMNEKYCFGHDRIQEAAYSIIDKQEICQFHLYYGVSIIESLSLIVPCGFHQELTTPFLLDVSFEVRKFIVSVHSSYAA